MTDLSPAAQAVNDAAFGAYWSDEVEAPNDHNIIAAAALRAAADRIAVPNQPNVTIWESGFCAGIGSAQEALRAIAAELKGGND